MRGLLLIAGVFWFLGLSAQLNQIDDAGKKQGKWEKTFKNGNVKYTGQFKNDAPVGTFKYYYPNGKLKSEMAYRSPQKSSATHYYLNGNKQSEGIYLNQKKDSVWNFYNEKGKLIAKEHYQNDVKNGKSISYHENGKKALVEFYTMGLLDGLQTVYFENGKEQRVREYKAGVAHGQYVVYDLKGNPVLSGAYKNGIEDGEWKEYSKGGLLYKKIIKAKPKPDSVVPVNGTFIKEYANGMPKEVANYKLEKLHGVYEEYYDNGRWELREKVDPKTGESDQYREMVGHSVKMRCNYVYGKKNGKCEYFFEDGTLKKVESYEMGELTD